MGRKTLAYEEYLASDVWKCNKAPINDEIPLQVQFNTGAHYWKEIQGAKDGLFYCKYCYDTKKFQTVYQPPKEIHLQSLRN